MAYITQANIEAIFGVENVRRWSNLENEDLDTDTDAISTAIAWAEAYVEDRFRPCGIYALPFSPTSNVMVVNWMATLAGIWLFQRRPNNGADATVTWIDRREQVEREMDMYISGGRRLNCTRAHTTNPTVPYVVR